MFVRPLRVRFWSSTRTATSPGPSVCLSARVGLHPCAFLLSFPVSVVMCFALSYSALRVGPSVSPSFVPAHTLLVIDASFPNPFLTTTATGAS